VLVANAEPGAGALVTNHATASAHGVSTARASTKIQIKRAPLTPCSIAAQADDRNANRSDRTSNPPPGAPQPIAKAAC
jgi:hypothetical protein